MAGLGVRDPISMASKAFLASREGSSVFLASWFDGLPFSVVDHREPFCRAREWARQQQHQFDSSCMKGLMESFDKIRYRAFQRAVEGKCSNWLNILPIATFEDAMLLQILIMH